MTDSTGKAARLEEERFHDLVHSVNSDGLQSMAWPGRRKSKAEQSDKGNKQENNAQNKGRDSKADKTADSESQDNTTKARHSTDKGNKANSKPKPEPKIRQKDENSQSVNILPQSQPIEGEWNQFCQKFKDYKVRKVKTKRVAVFLPESVWNTYQTVHSRDTSAAISVILEMFIERNKGNMKESITRKSTLL